MPRFMLRFPWILMLTLLLPSVMVGAEKKFGTFIDEAEPAGPASLQEGKQWAEVRANLPPWPADSDLVELKVDFRSPGNFRYFIDGRHLQVGADEVVRYTLVAEAPSGTRNVTVEGLRCTAQGTYRQYAYGANGAFIPIEEGDWQPISLQTGDRLHKELHGHFLCVPRAFAPRPVKDMIRAFKGQVQVRENAGFLTD